jgi:hypothetical protein
MQPAIFAFDFSMNKPAMTSFVDGNLDFYVWPSTIDEKSYNSLIFSDVNIHNRNLPPIKDKCYDQHSLILEHVHRSTELADIITKTIDRIVTSKNINKENVIISNEGFAFSAKGDAVLDLSGYKYILMDRLISKGYTNFRTYSPITIKKIAGCSKKGLGKNAMITAFGKTYNKDIPECNHQIMYNIKEDPQILKKKTNYVLCVDDIADSYWCMRTTLLDTNGNS